MVFNAHRIQPLFDGCATGYLDYPVETVGNLQSAGMGWPETGTFVTTLECIVNNAGSDSADAKAGTYRRCC
jgi:hypothetical protein